MPQIYKPTGRPRGRPPKAAKERIISATPLRNAPHMAEVFADLTSEQIDAIPIQGLARMLIQVAIKARDDKMLQSLVLGLMPYEMARKSETVTLSPEELRRVATAAKSEAGRRGLVIDIAGRRAGGTV